MPRCPICHRRLARQALCPEDGAQAPADHLTEPEQPPRVPGYTVGPPLGAGGFASVWTGTRDGGDRDEPLALKVSHVATDIARGRFEREADAMARIGPPHVPALVDRGVLDDGRPFLAMALLSGQTLAHRLEHAPRVLSLAEVRAIADSVLAGLEVSHARGVIHRDLNPSNVFLTANGSPAAVLLDFGTSRRVDPDVVLTRTGMVLGTAEYTSPEQLVSSRDVDARADIYSFGVLLYELLTLRVPFTGDRASIEHGHAALRPPRPGTMVPLPDPWEDLCLACLAKNPDHRPADVPALRRILGRLPINVGANPRGAQRAPTAPPIATLLSAATQTVVLLAVDLPDSDPEGTLKVSVEDIVARCKGTVVRRLPGRRHLCAFFGAEDEDPVRAAVAAAHDLMAGADARAVLHLEPMRVRRARESGRLRIYGAAVERPDDWLPATDWRGLLITAAAAHALPFDHTRQSPEYPGFHVFVTDAVDAVDAPLIGRGAVVDRAMSTLRACIANGAPELFTITGVGGVGKSRLARELADRVGRDHPDARIVRIRAIRRGPGHGDHTLRQLRDQLLDLGLGEHATHPGVDLPFVCGEGLRDLATRRPLVLIIDDAHHADERALDAVEYATLDAAGVALWVVAIAHPRLLRVRRQWGQRAHHHDTATLEPLFERDAVELARALLHPAEYPPEPALRRLARWTAGNPGLLDQLVQTLKRERIVRPRPGGDSWYLDTAALDRLPRSPADEWLAARELGALTPEVAACARLCSVLGESFSAAEVAWVRDAAERAGTAATIIDIGVGLDQLARSGVVARDPDGQWSFRHPGLQEAIHDSLPDGERHRLHALALAYWESPEQGVAADQVLAAIARHAHALGEHERAIDAYLDLGDRARPQHRYIDADMHYTAAIQLLDDGDRARSARALAGRGKVRYRIHRIPEALADLRAARAAAEVAGDHRAVAELLLEEATALDWAYQFAASAELIPVARALAADLDDERLTVRCLLAEGRACYRAENLPRAVDLLSEAAARSEQLGDREAQIISLVLLSPALVLIGKLTEAAARFQTVISLSSRAGDRLHLCAAYVNRMFLWSAQQAPERATRDLRRAVRLAREVGQPALERIVTHNLAEILYWSGEDDEALALARRARVLQQRFLPDAGLHDALLVARVQAARRRWVEVRELLEWIDGHSPCPDDAPVEKLLVRALEQAVACADGAAWDALLAEASAASAPGEEFLELLYFAAMAACDNERWNDAARALEDATTRLTEFPIWEARFARLRSALPSRL